MPHHRLVHAAFCLVVSAGAGFGVPAPAAEPCPERPPRLPAAARPSTAVAENLPAELHARELRLIDKGVSEFTGDVELRRGRQALSAGHLLYDKNTEMVDATGNVTFMDASGLSFQTQETHLNLGSRIGYAGTGSFRFEDGSARGDAERIDFEGPDRTRFTRVRYTTCAPGQDDWYLKMRELDLDTGKDIGTARHTSINFQDLPILYFPYFSFPISDERKSGFLVPQIGYASQRGLDISTPYYINLAPNYDDTLTPELMTQRGLQLQNEFRYLGRRSDGKLQFEILPNDRLDNGNTRAAGTYQHKTLFNPYWSTRVDVRGVSDKEYFDDFGDDLGVTSQTHLPQNAQVDYRGPSWNFTARVADYQTIDRSIAPADRPYAQLPQLTLTLNRPGEPNRLNYFFENELVSFDRDASITGERLSLSPSVSLPLSNSYAFLTPRIGLRYVAYHLSDAPDDATPAMALGVYSLDSGLIFERDSRWSERLFTQTLEPRLYYLYIPEKNQDSLPNFDTSVPDFSFYNLFRDNRFVGGDRIGDANQVTAAVTTRFIDQQDGVERARASLGRIYYLEDRQVNLPAGTTSTNASDIVAEVSATLASHWYVRSGAQWNREDNQTEKYNYYLQYNPAKDRIVTLGRRFSRDELEQIDISTEWPLATRWTLRARSLYSQDSNRNMETYAGVGYNACCWALRVIAKRRLVIDPLNTNDATQHFSLKVQLELTGLSKLGHIPDSPLRESVFSFPSPTATPLGSSTP